MSVAGAESGIRTAEAELDSQYGLLKGKCIGIYNRYRAVVCFPSLGRYNHLERCSDILLFFLAKVLPLVTPFRAYILPVFTAFLF